MSNFEQMENHIQCIFYGVSASVIALDKQKDDHAERIFTDFAKRGSAPDMAILGISRSGYPDNDAIKGLVEEDPFQ